MKQKMVVKVTMNGPKCRSKALKIAVALAGVESASLKGDDKSQIEVTGDGVDAVALTNLLRKNVGYAELLSVADAQTEDEPKEEEPKPTLMQMPYVYTYTPPYCMYQLPEYHEPSCSIM